MTNVTARKKAGGKNFEIIVDVDKALKFKKGENISIGEVVEIEKIFYDVKKGFHASEKDLQDSFKTTDFNDIASKIVKSGEIQIPVEYKHKELEGKTKQIVDFLVRNAVDPRTNRPYTPERIEKSIEESGVNITNKPIESQIKEIVSKLSLIIPIKIESKKIKLTVPAIYTGNVYGLLQSYKESEEWMNNGDLKCVVNIPIGFQMEFYDKLNSSTHGSVLSEEVKE